jgi:hypothetical protein
MMISMTRKLLLHVIASRRLRSLSGACQRPQRGQFFKSRDRQRVALESEFTDKVDSATTSIEPTPALCRLHHVEPGIDGLGPVRSQAAVALSERHNQSARRAATRVHRHPSVRAKRDGGPCGISCERRVGGISSFRSLKNQESDLFAHV